MTRPTRILVVSGLGDIHWVALKLQSFMDARGIVDPEVDIWNIDQRPRSMEFLKRIPFVKAGSYFDGQLIRDVKRKFRSCYMTGGVDVIPNLCGYDYFICVNGSLRVGTRIEETMDGCAVDWNYALLQSDAEKEAFASWTYRGPFVMLYFSDHGMFRDWINSWPVTAIATFVRDLAARLPEHRLVLTGSSWDREFGQRLMHELTGESCLYNLVDRTNFDQFMGMLRACSGFVGWCGGNSIMATHLRKPTYMLWSDYFIREFQTNWIQKDAIEETYFPRSVEDLCPEAAAEECASRIDTGEPAPAHAC